MTSNAWRTIFCSLVTIDQLVFYDSTVDYFLIPASTSVVIPGGDVVFFLLRILYMHEFVQVNE